MPFPILRILLFRRTGPGISRSHVCLHQASCSRMLRGTCPTVFQYVMSQHKLQLLTHSFAVTLTGRDGNVHTTQLHDVDFRSTWIEDSDVPASGTYPRSSLISYEIRDFTQSLPIESLMVGQKMIINVCCSLARGHTIKNSQRKLRGANISLSSEQRHWASGVYDG